MIKKVLPLMMRYPTLKRSVLSAYVLTRPSPGSTLDTAPPFKMIHFYNLPQSSADNQTMHSYIGHKNHVS